MKARLFWPLGIFLVLAIFLGMGLNLNPRAVPSPLIGKTAPDFVAPTLTTPDRILRREDMLGKVWMLNVWASWCAPCRIEHSVFVNFAKFGGTPVYGLNYKDNREDAQRWLGQLGYPYEDTISDPTGRIGINYGVYGVPETFVVDRAGIVRYKHVGPMTVEVMRDKIEPLLKKLNG